MALAGIYRCTSAFQVLRFPKVPFNFLTEKRIRKIHITKAICVDDKYLTSERPPSTTPKKPNADPFAAPPKKRKPLKSPEITLVSSDDVVSSVTLEDAEKLSKRRNLKLVKIIDFDTKTERPVYKLMTSQQYFQEEAKTKEKKKKEKDSALKDDKLFTLSSKIGENDLYNKVRQMHKAIKKKHVVRVYITPDGNPTRATEIAATIEEELNDLIDKKDRATKMHGTIKLHLNPKLETENEAASKDTKQKKSAHKETKEAEKNEIN